MPGIFNDAGRLENCEVGVQEGLGGMSEPPLIPVFGRGLVIGGGRCGEENCFSRRCKRSERIEVAVIFERL